MLGRVVVALECSCHQAQLIQGLGLERDFGVFQGHQVDQALNGIVEQEESSSPLGVEDYFEQVLDQNVYDYFLLENFPRGHRLPLSGRRHADRLAY